MAETTINDVLGLLSSHKVQPGVQLKIKGLLIDMVAVKNEEKGWRVRSELQGMLNCLELQGIISEAALVKVNDAVKAIWTPLARQFVQNRVGTTSQIAPPAQAQ